MLKITKEERATQRKLKQKRRTIIVPPDEKKTSIKQAPQTEREHLLDWMNARYITTRQKYVEQYIDKETGESRYATHGTKKGNTKTCLFDYALIEHLNHKRTIGVFAAKNATKFIAFDVDYENDLKKAKDVTFTLTSKLRDDFGLNKDELLVTLSGSKGFHIEVFFTDLVSHSKVERFYSLMLRIIEASPNEVELRPTPGQAIKLPLSINRKTGKRCTILHQEYMYELPDEELLSVKPVDYARIEAIVNDLASFYPASEYSPSEEREPIDPNSNFKKDIQMNAIQSVLTAGTLIEAGTRHNITLGIASLYNTEGHTEEDAFNIAWTIVEATYNKFRAFLNASWPLDKFYKETKRVVNVVYTHDLKLGAKENLIYISREDILFVMRARTRKEREMLMLMLVHNRKYANEQGEFYITNDQLTKYGATANRARLKSYWKGLQETNLLEVIKENVSTGRKMLIEGQEISVKDPNQYRLPETVRRNNEEKGTKLEDFNLSQFEELISQFLTEDETKSYFSKTQFYTRFKPFYEN